MRFILIGMFRIYTVLYCIIIYLYFILYKEKNSTKYSSMYVKFQFKCIISFWDLTSYVLRLTSYVVLLVGRMCKFFIEL